MKALNKINYDHIDDYINIKKNFFLSIKWTTILFFKIFWVYIRQLKYDPKGFFYNFFPLKKSSIRDNKIEKFGFEVFKISTDIINKINGNLKIYYSLYHDKSKLNNINNFDDTLFKLEKKKFIIIKNLLLSDNNFQNALNSISQYKELKKKPKINFISLQLISSRDQYTKKRIEIQKIKSCEYMHIDSVIGQFKILLYLTDVNVHNGPTSICVNTHNKGKPLIQHFIGGAVDNLGIGKLDNLNKKIFRSLPKFLQIKNNFGSDLDDKTELSKFLIENEKKLIGDMGTAIAFDPLSVHRGGLVNQGFRAILQISLSLK